MTRERIRLRIVKGALVPADNRALEILRERAFHIGDIVSADITKPRNVRFNALIHHIGQLVAQNIESFSGMNGHAVIKRLQLESGIACDESMIDIDGLQAKIVKPKSLAFDRMDDGEVHELARAICAHISAKYWPECTPEQIAEMAGKMID